MRALRASSLSAAFSLLTLIAGGGRLPAQVAPPLAVRCAFAGSLAGGNSFAPLLEIGNTLYGTTSTGGLSGGGTVFQVPASGDPSLWTLPLPGTAGAGSAAGLALGRDGSLYGAAQHGGPNGAGTIFKISPSGDCTVLHAFSALTFSHSLGVFVNAEGATPKSGLIADGVGNLYGVAFAGGASGLGTLFKVTPQGGFTVLHTFSGPDGAQPIGSLTRARNGTLYGTTFGGGTAGAGTVFQFAGGVLSTLYSFTGNADGAQPSSALLLDPSGDLYGAAATGGIGRSGTLFRITQSGKFTRLYAFSPTDSTGANLDGAFPTAALIRGLDGALYGAAATGGANATGTLFRLSPSNAFSVLYTFSAIDEQLTNDDGAFPAGALLQSRDGNLYGATARGGIGHSGTVFKLTLVPVLSHFSPTSGPIGTVVTLAGINLTEALSVTVNGVPAPFTILSDTVLTLTIPPGATTGRIDVVNPFGRGLTGARFKLTP